MNIEHEHEQTRIDRLNQVDWALVFWLLLSLTPGLGQSMAGCPGLYLSVLAPPSHYVLA